MSVGVEGRATVYGPYLGAHFVPAVSLGWLRHSFHNGAGDDEAVVSEWSFWLGVRII